MPSKKEGTVEGVSKPLSSDVDRVSLLRERIQKNESIYFELIDILTKISQGEDVEDIEELTSLIKQFSAGTVDHIDKIDRDQSEEVLKHLKNQLVSLEEGRPEVVKRVNQSDFFSFGGG